MPSSPFTTPTLASMNSLLPAFEFIEAVESDGRGAVYFAHQKSLDRRVAVKVFSAMLSEDAGFSQSFEKASNAMAAMRHPNLISIFDSGSVEGMSYVVMEFVPGKSLARSTGGSAIEYAQALRIIEGICEGMGCAHDKGIVHGNLDPSNILLNQNAEPKVGNFGVKHTDDSGASPYAAPELLAGSAPETMRSDVYAVATIFRELLTGSTSGSEAALHAARGEKITQLLEQATNPDPEQRMADVRVFHKALKAVAASEKTNANTKSKQPLAGAAQVSDVQPPRKKPSAFAKMGVDGSLVIKILIIVGLLFGVNLAWKNLKNTTAAREKENEEVLAKDKANKEKALADAKLRMTQKPIEIRPNAPQNNFTPEPAQHVETAEESLERLRSKLLSGQRSEMPVGTMRKGESDYFLVTERLGWAEAALFAENLGAHLAIPVEGAEVEWLSDEVAKNAAAWIGVGQGGAEFWVTCAGTKWQPSAEPKGSGQFLALDEEGALQSTNRETELPFIIEWHTDGSNPGTLAARLAAAGASQGKPEPIFPPGTVTVGERHFLYVSRPVSWQEAGKMATSAGGHLMVISTKEEAEFLRKLTGGLRAPEGIWLGGSLNADHWQWISGEAWAAADWADGADVGSDGYALVIRPGEGWDSKDSADAATGFIIEWSGDAKRATAQTTNTPALGAEATALLAKAKEVILAAEVKRKEALTANIKTLTWGLDAYVRGLNSTLQAIWSPEVEKLKACIKNDRLLPDKASKQDIKISPEMSKLGDYAVKKQGELDAKFIETTKAIRDAYVTRMGAIRDSALQAGQTKAAESAIATAASAENLESWVESLVEE